MCIGAGSAASTRSVPPTASESIRPAVAAAFTAVATTTFAPAPPESSWRALTGSKATLPLDVAALEIVPTSPPPVPGDVGALLSTPPAEAVRGMARDRLSAAGASGQAVFLVTAASLVRGSGGALRCALGCRLEVSGTGAGDGPGFAEASVQHEVSGPDAAFAETDVLCVPSDFEAFPLVMVEAMTRGVPVMASASGTVPEMLDDGAAGVVVSPATVEAWTAALTTALADRDRLAALGAAGRERALARYTDAAMADAYQGAFARLFGRPIPGGPAEPAELL